MQAQNAGSDDDDGSSAPGPVQSTITPPVQDPEAVQPQMKSPPDQNAPNQ
jgi:hypothetical protein